MSQYAEWAASAVSFMADLTTAILGVIALAAILFKRQEIRDALGFFRHYTEIELFSRLRMSAERLMALPSKGEEQRESLVRELAQLRAQLELIAEKHEELRLPLDMVSGMLEDRRRITDTNKVSLATRIIERIMKIQAEGYVRLSRGQGHK